MLVTVIKPSTRRAFCLDTWYIQVVDLLGCKGRGPAGGVRTVTPGTTGLWQPSVHSHVVVCSVDVGSSYPF